jgi:hypothetical protein
LVAGGELRDGGRLIVEELIVVAIVRIEYEIFIVLQPSTYHVLVWVDACGKRTSIMQHRKRGEGDAGVRTCSVGRKKTDMRWRDEEPRCSVGSWPMGGWVDRKGGLYRLQSVVRGMRRNGRQSGRR